MKDEEKCDNLLESELLLNVPAPWQLQGKSYICLLSCASERLDKQCFVTKSLYHRRDQHSPSLMIFVDYTHSPVGPYYELLFIPGRFNFEDGGKHFSISRIFVSSIESVVNGRQNWGIPKELAQFDVSYDKRGVDHIIVKRQGNVFAELIFRTYPLSLPFSTSLFPKDWQTLGQHDRNLAFLFRPKASGWLHLARLVKARINCSEFPPITLEEVKMTFKITKFKMNFPEATTLNMNCDSNS